MLRLAWCGLAFLWLFLRYEAGVVAWWLRWRLGGQIGLALVASLVLLFAGLFAVGALEGYRPPAGALDANPTDLEPIVAMSGSLFGMLAGASILWRLGWLSVEGPLWQRALRWLIGVVGLLTIWLGLRELLPDGHTPVAELLRFLRYVLVTLWTQLGAPLLFRRLGLVRS